MCGISVIISPGFINTKDIVLMNKIISHRGPDDEGFYLADSKNKQYKQFSHTDSHYEIKTKYSKINSVDRHSYNLALGHRRLSIVDLSAAGHQPMISNNGRYSIVFNGEIYNYKKIRQQLKSQGIQFKSNTDTEVLLNAWLIWGSKCLSRLKGMFSFVIYDQLTNKLYAVRDRFGIKPLYYYSTDQKTIYFASEIKQFTVLKQWQARQNYQVVYDFLNWGLTDHGHETFFKDVYQILPGEYLSVSMVNGQLLIKKTIWYKLAINSLVDNYEQEVASYQSLLVNSVNEHLNSDVHVGSCLSGGIDSSSIVGIVNTRKARKQIQKTFSALSEAPELDEGKWIDMVHNRYQLDAYFVTPSMNTLEASLNELTYYQDEPFGSSSAFAQWCVFKLAKENNIKVMLDGQGADEQLGGYASFRGVLLAEKLKQFHWSEFFSEYHWIKKYSGLSHNQLFQRVINPFVSGSLGNIIRKTFTDTYEQPNWLDIDFNAINPDDPFNKLGARTPSCQLYSIVQVQHSNLQSLLHLEDRNSMAHSIEARVPFLDHELVEKSISLPTRYKFHQGVSKRVLRDAMRDNLPDEIYRRYDKIGFATAEEKWMKSDKQDFFYDRVMQAINNDSSVINNNILPQVDAIFSGSKPFSTLVWRIISYGNWLKCYHVH